MGESHPVKEATQKSTHCMTTLWKVQKQLKLYQVFRDEKLTTAFRGTCLSSKLVVWKEKAGPQEESLETDKVLCLSQVVMAQVFSCGKLSRCHLCLGHLSVSALYFTTKSE